MVLQNRSMTPPQPLRVFLASPGDVADERGLALKVLEQLQYDPVFRGRIFLEAVAWDKPGAGTPMLATMTPQAAIAAGLPKPSECDLVIVVVWARMGTPLPLEQYRKPGGGTYLSGTEWEYLDALEAAQRDGRPEVLVYRRTEKRLLDPDDTQFEDKLRQRRNVDAFFAGFRNPDGSIRRGCNEYTTPEDFREQLELHLRTLIQRQLNTPQSPVVPSSSTPPLWQGSPFPGLRAFTPDDSPIFLGRGRETDALLEKLRGPGGRLLAVVGASGSGKSSLVGAGLIPRLADNALEGSRDWLLPGVLPAVPGQRKQWTGLRFTPGELGGNPFLALAAKFAPLLPDETLTPGRLAERLANRPETFAEFIGQTLTNHPAWAEALVFVDQFEELFTVVEAGYRHAFVRLLSIAAAAGRLRLVLTVRADFYHKCVEFPELAELLRTGSFPLAAPSLGTLHRMIVGPAARAGLEFEEGLPERLLDATGQDPGALALLAFALHALYQAKSATGLLTHAAYESTGEVHGAIARRAESTYDGLPAEAREALERVFRDLVEVDERGTATRRRANRAVLVADAGADALVAAFTDARLLVGDRGSRGEAVVEVAHEALLREWPRLADWIRDTADDHRLRRQITQLAAYWDAHERRDEHRWPDDRVVEAARMLSRLGLRNEDFSAVEQAFLGPLEPAAMLREIQDPATGHERRAMIGVRLALLGDPRPGVGLDAEDLPDIEWVELPGGEVTLEIRSDPNDPDSPVAKTLVRRVEAFRMARYPVTVAQFQAFVRRCHGEGGWRLPPGSPVALPESHPPPRHRARYGNHPADSVNFWDAIVFCYWLTVELAAAGRLPEGAAVRLPTEFEWQWAATSGKADYRYPWGPNWEPWRANTYESELGRSTAVGMYPGGTSPDGIFDLAGNLWEWCGNAFENPDDLGLPQSGADRRVVRGGSWPYDRVLARCVYRVGYPPGGRGHDLGLRFLCGAPIA